MVRSFLSSKARRLVSWTLCSALMVYALHSKMSVVTYPQLGLIEDADNSWMELGASENSFPNITPFKCVSTAKLYKDVSSVICVKDPSVDKFVSGNIIKTGVWEKHIIKEVMRSLDNFPTAVFLDIGMYTVMVAQMKRSVVAVDPIKENLAYIRQSVTRAGNQNYVQYVARPVSDVVERFVPVTDHKDNQGGTRLVPADQAPHLASSQEVTTITLDQVLLFTRADTVIIKMDVEGFECRVLRPYLSSPLPGVYLPYIILEWMHIKLNLDNNCPDLQAFIDQLSDAGYQPYDLVNKSKMMRYDDLLWVHKSAKPLF